MISVAYYCIQYNTLECINMFELLTFSIQTECSKKNLAVNCKCYYLALIQGRFGFTFL